MHSTISMGQVGLAFSTSSIFAFILNVFFFTYLCPFFSFADIIKKRYIVRRKSWQQNLKAKALSIMN